MVIIGAEAETERECSKHIDLTEQRRFFDITDRNVMVLELKHFRTRTRDAEYRAGHTVVGVGHCCLLLYVCMYVYRCHRRLLR